VVCLRSTLHTLFSMDWKDSKVYTKLHICVSF
jgi:hypothetical protein